MDSSSFSAMNRGTDFQPSTTNPQSINTPSLQVPAANLQPVQGQLDLSGEQLNQSSNGSGNLRVVTDQVTGTTAQASPPATAQASPLGFLMLFSLLAALIGVIMVVSLLRRRKQESPLQPAPVEEAPQQTQVAEISQPLPEPKQITPKPVQKAANNKNKVKKKKKSSKKRRR